MAVERLKGIVVADDLDFSKMEAGGMDILPVDYRVEDMLSEVVNMVWEKAVCSAAILMKEAFSMLILGIN